MRPRICVSCSHPVGTHSHMSPHPCKQDGCTCLTYSRPVRR